MTDEEFRSAFETHQDAVYRFLWRMAGPDSAEDLAQDVFLALLRHRRRFDPTRGTLRTRRAEMKSIERLPSLCLAMLVLTTATATLHGQSSRLEGGVTSHGEFDFFWETRLEPPVPPLGDGFGMTVLETLPNVVHRVMLDRGSRVYFGYDARVDVLPGGAFRMTLGPLTMTDDLRKLLDDPGAWRLLPSPEFPPPQTIRAGEVLELPLLTNSGWGQKLTDYVTVRPPAPRTLDVERREFAFAPGSARDFTVDDAELRVSRVTVTSRRQEGRVGSMRRAEVAGDFAGTVLWLYVPYRGRFLLSLRPHSDLGFERAGEVRGSQLRFIAGGTTYSLASQSRIAPGQTAFNLYVLFQPGWRPTYPNANVDTFHLGAADKVQYLVGK